MEGRLEYGSRYILQRNVITMWDLSRRRCKSIFPMHFYGGLPSCHRAFHRWVEDCKNGSNSTSQSRWIGDEVRRTITRKQDQPLLLLLPTLAGPILSSKLRIPPIPQVQQRFPKLPDRDVFLLWLSSSVRRRMVPIGIPGCVTCRYRVFLTYAIDVVEC
jgi:hypothetical protein